MQNEIVSTISFCMRVVVFHETITIQISKSHQHLLIFAYLKVCACVNRDLIQESRHTISWPLTLLLIHIYQLTLHFTIK